MSGQDPAFAIQIDALEGVVAFGLAVRMTIDALDLAPKSPRIQATRDCLAGVRARLDRHVPPALVGVPLALTIDEADAVRLAVASVITASAQHPAEADARGLDRAWLIAIRGTLDTARAIERHAPPAALN